MRITKDQIKIRDQTGNPVGQKGIKSNENLSLPGCGHIQAVATQPKLFFRGHLIKIRGAFCSPIFSHPHLSISPINTALFREKRE